MKTNGKSALVMALLTLSSACAIHPLPQDVTGNNTARIVRKIRCEARDSIQRKTILYLTSLDERTFPKAHALGIAYQASYFGPEEIKKRAVRTTDFAKIEPAIGDILLY